jgi:uncharacterized membrane protein
MSDRNAAVGIFDSHTQAQTAVEELRRSGLDINKLSIVGRDEHVDGYHDTGDRMKYWGKQGACWGGLWGLLLGAGLFWVPGLGPLLVAGPLGAMIVGGMEGAVVVGGLSAVGAGLYSMGIPKDSILQYETAIQAGKFVLVFHGTAGEVEKTRQALARAQAAEPAPPAREPAAAA